ncbi:MAG: VWA domain-containing protein [Verrucomicrobia bacterium]|nr:VWA domain-containing protein [Verrucomicrobiota bacterium]
MKHWVWFASLLGVLFTTPRGLAAGLIIIDPPTWPSPGPQPPIVAPPWPPGPRPPRPVPPPYPAPPPRPVPPSVRVYPFAPLEVSYHRADIRIRDQIASVAVEQEFYNPNPGQLEGTFLFPVPKGAQIKKFAMEIGGKPVEAELLPADRARRIYEDIVRKMRDPALMEYAGRDLIRVRIFPIEPQSRKRVTLSYTQLLRAEAGLIEFVYPLNTEKFSAKPIRNVGLKLDIETTRALKTIYSPSHSVEVKRQGSNRATIGYEVRDAKPESDFQLYYAAESDGIGIHLMTYRPAGDDGYFLLLASPGTDVADQKIVPKDVAFVLDTSGSMAGKKLEQAKKALQFCVENLNESDRFEIIRFSTEVEPLFDGLVEASKQRREKAADFIKSLRPMGGTAIDEALRKALALRSVGDGVHRRPEISAATVNEPAAGVADQNRPFVVIFLTDGLPTLGVTNEDQIVAGVNQKAANTRVFCFGIGNDVNTHLLDRITESTRAASQYVIPEEDIEVKVSNFFTKIKEPVLANLKVDFPETVRVSKLYPNALPDLFKGEQLVLVGRYSGAGSGSVVVQGTAGRATKRFAEDVKFAESAAEHDFIPRLWATRRVGYLLDEIRLHGENKELKDEVTELARQFGIVTPYTAYLIVEDEKERGVPLTTQSLPQLQTDDLARGVAGGAYRNLSVERSGGGAVAAARYGLALKSAEAPADALALGNAEAERSLAFSAVTASPNRGGFGGGAGTASAAAAASGPVTGPAVSRIAQYTQQARFVNGKNFFQNGNQWIDSSAQKAAHASRVRIQFNSPEYFDLAVKKPEARAWLALGQNVQFVMSGTLYEIFE